MWFQSALTRNIGSRMFSSYLSSVGNFATDYHVSRRKSWCVPRPYYLYFHVLSRRNSDQEALAEHLGSRLERIAVTADSAAKRSSALGAKRHVFQHRNAECRSSAARNQWIRISSFNPPARVYRLVFRATYNLINRSPIIVYVNKSNLPFSI